MGERFTMKLLSLMFLVASVAAAQSAPPVPAQTTPRPAQSGRPAFDPNAPYQSAPPRKDIPAIAKAANGAIVTIITAVNDKPIAQGTGFLVSPDGVIVTNYHVIETGNVAAVKFPDGTVLSVDGVLAADKVRDLAIIKVHGKTFRTLTLGNSDQIQVGEEVVAIGNPLSLESTVSNGIVSGMRTSKEQGGKFLQTTAPISPGSSGGPLFNMLGEVVGINSMYLEGGENLNFAIPINDAKRLLVAKFSKIQNLPNETETDKAQTPSSTEKIEKHEAKRITIGLDKGFDIRFARDIMCRYLVCRTKPEDMVERLEGAVTVEFQTNPACHDIALVEYNKAQWWLVLKVSPSSTDIDWKESEWAIGTTQGNGSDSVGGGLDDIHEALRDICEMAKGAGGTIE